MLPLLVKQEGPLERPFIVSMGGGQTESAARELADAELYVALTER